MPIHCVGLALASAPLQVVPVPVTAPTVLATTPATVVAPAPAGSFVVAQDTPVELMAIAEVNTDKAQPGDLIRFRVNHAIEVDGRIVVPVGTPAFGRVTSAKDAGGLGKSGRMTAKLLHIQLGDVEIPLEGEMSAKGTGAAGVAILLTGWAGFFHRGNNAKIKAGEIVSGFVSGDVPLDLSGERLRAFTPPPTIAPATSAPVEQQPLPSPVPATRR